MLICTTYLAPILLMVYICNMLTYYVPQILRYFNNGLSHFSFNIHGLFFVYFSSMKTVFALVCGSVSQGKKNFIAQIVFGLKVFMTILLTRDS